jgi:DNA polymerase III subunit epsilon
LKEIYIDCETTGLDPQLNGIWQIAGMVVHDNHAEPFDFKIAPHKGDVIEPTALEMSGMTEEEMLNLEDPFKVHRKLTTLFGTFVDKYDKKDKFIFYGYNARFDSNFLREWFAKCGDKYFGSWFWTPPVDIMATAAFHLAKERPAMANFKLETVVKWLGLKLDEEGDFHDADIDIKYTYQLAKYIRNIYAAREL